MVVSHLNLYEELPGKFSGTVKIRKKSKELKCEATHKENSLVVKFKEPAFAVTPGQVAVFYDGDKVVCSGVIEQ